MSTDSAPVVINVKECPIQSVQVYLDRAEVVRSIRLTDLPQNALVEEEYKINIQGIVLCATPEVSIYSEDPILYFECEISTVGS